MSLEYFLNVREFDIKNLKTRSANVYTGFSTKVVRGVYNIELFKSVKASVSKLIEVFDKENKDYKDFSLEVHTGRAVSKLSGTVCNKLLFKPYVNRYRKTIEYTIEMHYEPQEEYQSESESDSESELEDIEETKPTPKRKLISKDDLEVYKGDRINLRAGQ